MRKPGAVDEARALDRKVANILADEKRVVPMVVPEILIGLPRSIWLRRVVGAAAIARCLALLGRVGGKNRAALRKIQVHVARKMDREAHVSARGEVKCTSARGSYSFNRAIYRRRVDGFSVAHRAILMNIEYGRLRSGLLRLCAKGDSWQRGSSGAEATGAQKITA